MLQIMDSNGDGRIAASEFTGKRQPFSDFDQDGDGFATRQEIEAALGNRQSGARGNERGPAQEYKFSNFGPLTGVAYGDGRRKLIVMAHGDVSGGGPGDRLYKPAQRVARRFREATVVAVLRPGYADSNGRRSPGTNHSRSDQYTRKNNDLLAETIRNLRDELRPEMVIAVGFSGGAAQTGTIIGRFPRLIDVAILVGCPCDVPAHFQQHNGGSPVRSESPHRFVDQVPAETRVILLTGSKDKDTPPFQAERHAKRLGDRASVKIIDGAGHKFIEMLPSVMAELGTL